MLTNSPVASAIRSGTSLVSFGAAPARVNASNNAWRGDRHACRRRGQSPPNARRARRAPGPAAQVGSTSVLRVATPDAGAAVARALQRRQPGDHGVGELEPGRGRAPHGEGRGVQLMIREQHQRAADQVGGVPVSGAQASRSADAAARQTARRSAWSHQQPTIRAPAIARPSGARSRRPDRRLPPAPARQSRVRSAQHGARPPRSRASQRTMRADRPAQRDRRGDVPQQCRGMFQRVLFGEVDAVHAAVDRTSSVMVAIADPSPADRHRNCAGRAAPARAPGAPSGRGCPPPGNGGLRESGDGSERISPRLT